MYVVEGKVNKTSHTFIDQQMPIKKFPEHVKEIKLNKLVKSFVFFLIPIK